MKIREGIVLQEVCGQWVAVATGSAAQAFPDIAKLNKTGAFVWRLLEQGAEPDDIAAQLAAAYGIGLDRARADVKALCDELVSVGIAKE